MTRLDLTLKMTGADGSESIEHRTVEIQDHPDAGALHRVFHVREYSVLKTACPAPYSGFVAINVRGSLKRFATPIPHTSLRILCKQAGQVKHCLAAGSGQRRRTG